MNQREIEDLFDRNADMRLLELRHNDLVAPAKLTRTGGSFGAESIVASNDEAAFDESARLRVAIAAVPATGVIPGAVVGIAIDVFNDGNGSAPETKLQLSLPHESQFRTGSLRVDGAEPIGPEQLFSAGLPIARLPGTTSTKVTFQLAVLPGLGALFLQPRLQAEGVPVVGTVGLSIKRGPVTPLQHSTPAVPFYELDDDELDDENAAETVRPELPPVLEPVASAPAAPAPPPPEPMVLETVAAAPIVDEPVVAAPVDEPVLAERRVVPPAPARLPEPPVAAPVAAPVAPPDRMPRFRSIGAADVALVRRLLAAPSPGIVAHYVAIATIACTESASGADTSGFDAFVRADLEMLGRALVLARLGKSPAVTIDQAQLDRLELNWNPTHAPPQTAGTFRLRRDLREKECAAVAGLLQRSQRDAALRLRIALLALAGGSFEPVANPAMGERCATALGAYRSAVLAWLVPMCVASSSPNGTAIVAPPVAVDEAGRTLFATLDDAIAHA